MFDTISHMIRKNASINGNKTALICNDRSLSYRQLDINSNMIADLLRRSGVRKGDHVAFVGKNSEFYFEVLIGSAKVGAILTPVNWRLAQSEIGWILSDAEAKLVFAEPQYEPACGGVPTISLEPATYAARRDACSRLGEHCDISPDDVAIQLYTSGTTGRPKGAMLTHRNLLVFRSLPAEQQPVWNRWTEQDVSLVVMPVFHIGGTGFGLQTLCAGATGLVVSDFDAGEILDFISDRGLSKLFLVPSALHMVLRHPKVREVDYSNIRTILYGASPIPKDLLEEAMRVFDCGFVQMYGMTESCGTIAALTPEDHRSPDPSLLTSAGRALDGVELAIRSTNGTFLQPGEVGEIVTRSPLNMAGYWGRPDATAEAITADGWLRTGDVGVLNAEGYLFIKDRLKDMIVSGGENVYPAEVEQALLSLPGIMDAAVIGVPSERWGEEVKAFLVMAPGADSDRDALIGHLRACLAGYKLPKSIEFINELPRNASGKVLRRELRAPYWIGRERPI